jgi:hypothetical protein
MSGQVPECKRVDRNIQINNINIVTINLPHILNFLLKNIQYLDKIDFKIDINRRQTLQIKEM